MCVCVRRPNHSGYVGVSEVLQGDAFGYRARFAHMAKGMARSIVLAFLFPVPDSIDQDWLRDEGIEDARSIYGLIESSYQNCAIDRARLERDEPEGTAERILQVCDEKCIPIEHN